jgi:hypothetical protein
MINKKRVRGTDIRTQATHPQSIHARQSYRSSIPFWTVRACYAYRCCIWPLRGAGRSSRSCTPGTTCCNEATMFRFPANTVCMYLDTGIYIYIYIYIYKAHARVHMYVQRTAHHATSSEPPKGSFDSSHHNRSALRQSTSVVLKTPPSLKIIVTTIASWMIITNRITRSNQLQPVCLLGKLLPNYY